MIRYRKLTIILNLAMAVMVLYSWLSMFAGIGNTEYLMASRLNSLKFFTIDSNLLLAASALVAAFFEFFKADDIPKWVYALKLAGTVSVTVTLLTVLFFLGPVFGFLAMIAGVSLYLHLIVPLLAIFVFCLLEGSAKLTLRHTFPATIPLLIYLVFYLGNILINGIGEGKSTNDWYGFITFFGFSKMPILALVFALGTWLIALLLYKCGKFSLNTKAGHD